MIGSAFAGAYPGAAHDARWRTLTFPPSYGNPAPRPRYHMVVIGAGPAGLICALGAAGLGAHVALVEHRAMGGDCLNVGCVPSKALLEYVRHHPERPGFDEAFGWMREVRAAIAEHDSVERYTRAGVDVFLGTARFLDRSTVQVHDLCLSARRIVIATGARPHIPDVPGLSAAEPLTNETVFEIPRAPASLAILGAGPVGCELAQALAALGVKMHLLDSAGRVLPTESPGASAAVASALQRAGVSLHLNAKLVEVRRRGSSTVLKLADGEVGAERVLVAAGRRANTSGLELDTVGVELTPDGLIEVDHRLRTTAPRVFAAGDVCTSRQYTHHADAQARIVIQNALFAPTASTRKLLIPHCTFTTPEVAQIGKTQDELERADIDFDLQHLDFSELDRGRAAGNVDHFAEVLTKRKTDELLGATIVGENAGDLIAPLCIAMSNRLTLRDLGKTVLPYPTHAEYLRLLTDRYNRTRLTPMVRKLLNAWFQLRA